jgi:hypothetical protein
MSNHIICVAFSPFMNLLSGYHLIEEGIPQYCGEREERYIAGCVYCGERHMTMGFRRASVGRHDSLMVATLRGEGEKWECL